MWCGGGWCLTLVPAKKLSKGWLFPQHCYYTAHTLDSLGNVYLQDYKISEPNTMQYLAFIKK